MERYGIKISNLEVESTWVEINNDKRKNIIIGSTGTPIITTSVNFSNIQ